MKTAKVFKLILLITLISLFYVRQQVELIELSYDIFKTEKRYNSLLDQNEQLSYNITVLSSLDRLEDRLASKRDRYVILEDEFVVKPESTDDFPYKVVNRNSRLDRFIKQVESIFTVNAQAEAKSTAK